jgi:tetratricopeptide (TPR) repeat protein
MYLNGLATDDLRYGSLEDAAATLAESASLLRGMSRRNRGSRWQAVNEAHLLRNQGALEMARARFLVQREANRDDGELGLVGTIATYLGSLFYEQGELAAAADYLDEAIALGGYSWSFGLIHPRALLCAVQAAQGRHAEALATLATAEQLATGDVSVFERTMLGLGVARVASILGPVPSALVRWAEAVAALDKAGLRWWGAQARREWAAYLAAEGDPAECAEAARLLDEAVATFEAIGAPYYADKVRAERAALDVAP